MGLFIKLLKLITNTKKADRHLPSFWEDDYCQVEIIPRKNVESIKKSITQIDEFAAKANTAYGYTDIFIREELPFPTLKEEMRMDYFEKLLTEKGFVKAKQIRYNGYKTIDCTKDTSNAFISPFIFFYDCKNEFINHIWISTSLIISTNDFNKISEALYELGEASELILIDWNSSKLIDLSDKKQIENYLMSYWK